MPTKLVRKEIYDENGLVRVEEVEVEDIEPTIEEKEQQLLDLYQEIQEMKSRLENNQ